MNQNRFTALLHILALGAFIVSGSPKINAKDIPKPLASLPTETINNRLVVVLPVAHYELRMVLDTGATSTALFQSSEHEFADLKKTGSAQIIFPALDESVTGSKLEQIDIKFGRHIYSPKELLLIHKRPPIGDRLNFKFDGVLGQDFFMEYVVEVNPKNQTINLHPKGTNLRRYFFTRTRLTLKDTSPYILFKNKFPWERRSSKKQLLLDTGFPGLMVVWNETHFKLAAGSSNVEKYKAENRGIFTRADFTIGKLKFYRAPIFIAANIPIQAQKRDGIIGANVVNQFHHVIDFSNGQLLLGASRYNYDRIDGTFYVPNNETYIFKRFASESDGFKVIIQ